MRCYVIMGVAGCGKTSVGAAVAARTVMTFVDGDTLHPRSNIEKISKGVPLEDDHRAPWLVDVGKTLAEIKGPSIIGCSALKRHYRDIIRDAAQEAVCFLHLDAPKPIVAERMAARRGHFMPISLLDSQYAVLEPLEADEIGRRVDIAQPFEDVVRDGELYMKEMLG
ncbi:MAG: gluconokinase [Pseudomonadota bacterium]